MPALGDGDHVRAAGREPDEVATRAPAVGRVGEQVDRRERRRQAEPRRHDAEPVALLRRIEVDDDDHDILALPLRERDQLVGLRLEPGEVVEPLQGRMRAPDLVQPPDQRQQRPLQASPLLELVLLRVEVLLAARPHRHVLARLVARVDPVARRQRGGEHEPRLEGRPASFLEVRVEDVGRVRPHVGPVERRPRARLLDELDELGLRVLPGEVGVGLAEAELGERRHRRRPGERLGQEDRLRMERLAPRRSATPRTAPASCADCRPGTRGFPARTSRARRRAVRSRAPRARPCPSRGCGCPDSAWAGSRRT